MNEPQNLSEVKFALVDVVNSNTWKMMMLSIMVLGVVGVVYFAVYFSPHDIRSAPISTLSIFAAFALGVWFVIHMVRLGSKAGQTASGIVLTDSGLVEGAFATTTSGIKQPFRKLRTQPFCTAISELRLVVLVAAHPVTRQFKIFGLKLGDATLQPTDFPDFACYTDESKVSFRCDSEYSCVWLVQDGRIASLYEQTDFDGLFATIKQLAESLKGSLPNYKIRGELVYPVRLGQLMRNSMLFGFLGAAATVTMDELRQTLAIDLKSGKIVDGKSGQSLNELLQKYGWEFQVLDPYRKEFGVTSAI
jgi:hypothetical protein